MPKKDPALKVIPMGGLDGIGKNMTVFEYGNDMVLVDAGLMFPDDEQPGIDLVLPDYTYVLENEDKLRGILITHGHEDHIGALPYLLMDLTRKVPIYSSKLSLGFIEGKLAEHKIVGTKLREVTDGSKVQLGAFDITFFSMTHSIPAAFGIHMKTPAGTLIHSGDFKLDQTPIDGVRPNYAAITKFGSEGLDLLLSDSTNANRPGMTPSEASVGAALRHIIKNATGRVFVASFSSHIHRLQQVCDASVAVKRKVVVTGRSMITNTKVAPLSALARMANGEHKSLSIRPQDTVIISATPVPGNEKSVQSIINALSKIGCEIYDKSKALVHVSGHGSQEELKLMLGMARPKNFMPVHGEAVHLRAHAELAQQMGVPANRIFILDNGDTLEMRNGKVTRGQTVESGVVYVDGLSVTDANPVVLRDRQRLSQDGIVTAVLTLVGRNLKPGVVEISGRGVSFADDDELMNDAQNLVRNSIEKASKSEGANIEAMRKSVRNALSNFLWSKTRTRPMVIPVIMEV